MISSIQLDPKEWGQFHSPSHVDEVFFAITTALLRASKVIVVDREGRSVRDCLVYKPADVPAVAHGAIVFHQAWHAFDGSYDTNNPFHGYASGAGTQSGYLRNLRAMRDFMAALEAQGWDGALAEAIAVAEAISTDDWEDESLDVDFFWGARGCKLGALFPTEGVQDLITLDLLNQAAAYVQKHCPVAQEKVEFGGIAR